MNDELKNLECRLKVLEKKIKSLHKKIDSHTDLHKLTFSVSTQKVQGLIDDFCAELSKRIKKDIL